jgi:hypothetical protein
MDYKEVLMIKPWKIVMITFCLTGLVLSACGGNAPAAAPTVDTTALVTQIAQTLQAEFTQKAILNPSATAIPQVLPSATLLPSVVPLPSATSFSLPTLAPATATALPVSSGGTTTSGSFAPAALFAVNHVVTTVNNAGMSTNCPPGYTFKFTATIGTNGPGAVTYDWEFSNGTKSDVQTLEFTSAAYQTVSTEWTVGKDGEIPTGNTYKGWARITIIKPNNQVFSRAAFTMQCTS